MSLEIAWPDSRRVPPARADEDVRVSLGALGPDGSLVAATAEVPLDFLLVTPARARLMVRCDLERSLAGVARRQWGAGALVRDPETGAYRWESELPAAAVPTAA